MSCNYCWNQPKKYERYDLYLDGKIKADDFVYRTKDENGKIISTVLSEKVADIEERLETHFTFNTDYATIEDLETAFGNGELKETVIYVVKNETVSDKPDSRDSYNEYMVVTVKGADGSESKTLELIGSGSYAKHEIDVDVEKNRAETRENDIQKKLTTITGYDFSEDLATKGGNIHSRIVNEIDRATEAENKISGNLQNESNRAKEEEAKLDSKIDTITGYELTEEGELKDGVLNVDTRIKNEIERATKAESGLSVRIKTIEDYNIDTRVKQIESDLPSEVNRAKKAEEGLDKKIDATKGELQGEIEEHNGRISAIEVLELSNVINELKATVGKLTKNIVVLELDKGFKITHTEIVDNATVEVSTNNLQLGDNKVNVETSYTFGQPTTKTNECTVVVAEDGTLTSDGVTVNINESYTVVETRDEKEGDATYTLKGDITVSISGTHKNPLVTVGGSLESGQTFVQYPEPEVPSEPEIENGEVTEPTEPEQGE